MGNFSCNILYCRDMLKVLPLCLRFHFPFLAWIPESSIYDTVYVTILQSLHSEPKSFTLW